MTTITFPVVDLRTVKDPTHPNIKRSSFYVPIYGMPSGIPIDANPRSHNPDSKISRELRDSLVGANPNTSGYFHLRNQGITILADAIDYDANNHICNVSFFNSHKGIVNGNHTYQAILDVIDDYDDKTRIPKEYVKVEVVVGLDDNLVPEIAGALNTSAPVKDQSIDNLAGLYNWIKEVLKDYKSTIKWEENGAGNIGIEYILKYMACMDIDTYPHGGSHPTSAYSAKSKVLSDFSKDPDRYCALMSNVLLDICKLHDHIALGAQGIWNTDKNGRFARTKMTKEKRKNYRAVFAENEYPKTSAVPDDAVILPILAAFRVYLQKNDQGAYEWKVPFAQVIKAWREVACELLSDIDEVASKKDMSALGKDPSVWKGAYKTVALKEMSER